MLDSDVVVDGTNRLSGSISDDFRCPIFMKQSNELENLRHKPVPPLSPGTLSNAVTIHEQSPHM